MMSPRRGGVILGGVTEGGVTNCGMVLSDNVEVSSDDLYDDMVLTSYPSNPLGVLCYV